MRYGDMQNAMATGSDKSKDPSVSQRRAAARGDRRDVGVALRAAYQQTVEEAIPAEMLDLLGKLR